MANDGAREIFSLSPPCAVFAAAEREASQPAEHRRACSRSVRDINWPLSARGRAREMPLPFPAAWQRLAAINAFGAPAECECRRRPSLGRERLMAK